MKKNTTLVFMVLSTWTMSAQAETAGKTWQEPSAFSADVQLGVDHWDVDASAPNATTKTRLFLADSTPQWHYSNTTPWITFDGHAQATSNLSFRIKYRGNKSSGGRLDDASFDWAISPFLGIRAGVVDFKTSWCRTYEHNSPWVRENDPFCTVRTTDQGTGAAPGLQVYVKNYVYDYDVQAAVGFYRPRALGYDKTEFNNFRLSYGSTVEKNSKTGISLNVVNTQSNTELRLSWMHAYQRGNIQTFPGAEFYNMPQKGNLYYMGYSFPVTEDLRARLTHLHSDVKYASLSYPGGELALWEPPLLNEGSVPKSSSTLELIYQPTANNIFSAAYSLYRLSEKTVSYRYAYADSTTDILSSASQPLDFSNKSFSLAWRRDHGRGFFSSVQWTRATVAQTNTFWDYGTGTWVAIPRRAKGHALGFRLGYRF